VAGNITMASLKESPPDNSLKLCPAFSAWNKNGCPKTNERLKSVMEFMVEKKKKAAAKKMMPKKTVGTKRKAPKKTVGTKRKAATPT
jgi:hypothetical protein